MKNKKLKYTAHLWFPAILLILVLNISPFSYRVVSGNAAPPKLTVVGHDSRIDLRWEPSAFPDLKGYKIYRSLSAEGPFKRINKGVHYTSVYSDFLGENGQKYFYYVTGVDSNLQESSPSDTLSATSVPMSDEQLLTSVQEATFRYFYDYGHPVSGLSRERTGISDMCTSGGTGMGLMVLMIGAERGFESRENIAARIQKMLFFLQNKATRYHGAFAHWINGSTGATIPFSKFDDGGDLVETAFLVQGLLTIRKYFTADNPIEKDIRYLATKLWQDVEWDWYLKSPQSDVLYWHWSANYDWQKSLSITGYHEGMITYLLAIASPTYAVPEHIYRSGWAHNAAYPFVNGKTFYGYKQWVGNDYGGPLFFTHYSFLGFDPRNKSDGFCNYFENNRNTVLINRAYCIDNPKKQRGYAENVWGLTASDQPAGYAVHAPFDADNGTITPTAAISSMPYTPQESISALKHFYHEFGDSLWAEFGFKDAFNLNENWFAESYLAIDQGPIVIMIENYRTQLCWNLFMANREIQQMLTKMDWRINVNTKE